MCLFVAGVVVASTVVPALGGVLYFEGWDAPGSTTGWIPNTTQTSIAAVDAGGRPNGYLRTFGTITGSFAIGAVSPALRGNYAAIGVNAISFDLLFVAGTFTEAAFRVRFRDGSHNGWRFPLATHFEPGVWQSFVIGFDPTWSDADAVAAGWIQEPISPSFSATMADVIQPEIRLSGTGYLEAGVDNFSAARWPSPQQVPGQWTSGGPVTPDALRGFALDPTRPATLYAAAGSTLFTTTDGGAHWSSSPYGGLWPFPVSIIWALAVAPQSPVSVYAGTANGLFKSVDGGVSWSSTGLTGREVLALAVDPQTPTTLYAGTWIDGVFKSTDGGAQWTRSDSGITGTITLDSVLVVDPRTPATLYVNTIAGVFKSTDGGAHWSAINAGLPTNTLVTALAVDPQAPDILYAGTWGGGIFKSTDGGGHWAASTAGLTYPAGGCCLSVTTLTVDPQAPTTVYAGTSSAGVFRSADRGGRWAPVNTGLSYLQVSALQISPSGVCLHATAQNAVFDLASRPDPCAPLAHAPVVAAVLPASRSVQVGQPATAFATIINAATTTAVGCGITPLERLNAMFTYQTTDPMTNALTGTANAPVDVPAGGLQTFVIAFTPTSPFDLSDVSLIFTCENTISAPIQSGLNTLLLSASAAPVPDIVALVATPSLDGIVTIPGAAGTGVFAVATVNVGSSATITASVDMGSGSWPVSSIVLCQTNPVSGACLQAPASKVTTHMDAGETPTFGVFVGGLGIVPFDPANNRIFVRFKDINGVMRGATSVAVRTQ
jgi:hypothetical protein